MTLAERSTHWLTVYKPKSRNPIGRGTGDDEQSDARERRSRANWQLTVNRRRPVIGDVRGQTPGTAENPVGQSFPPRCRWLRSDLSTTEFSVAGLVPCAGRSRLERWIPPALGIFRSAVVCPEGAGPDQPGTECSAAPGGGGEWVPKP